MFMADCWKKVWNDFSIILKSQTTTEENIDSTIRYLKAVPFISWKRTIFIFKWRPLNKPESKCKSRPIYWMKQKSIYSNDQITGHAQSSGFKWSHGRDTYIFIWIPETMVQCSDDCLKTVAITHNCQKTWPKCLAYKPFNHSKSTLWTFPVFRWIQFLGVQYSHHYCICKHPQLSEPRSKIS